MLGIDRRRLARLQMREDRRGQQLELVQRRAAVGVFRGHHLALLGDPQPALHGAGGLGGDGALGRRPAAADRAAAAVEEDRAQAVPRQPLRQPPLGLVELPGRADEAAVLVAVGIAEHHLDQPVARAHAALGRRHLQQVVEDRRRVAEVLDRLEQRHHPEVQLLAAEAGIAGQQIDPEDVVARAAHRQDEGAERVGVVRDMRLAHQREQVQKLAGLGAEPAAVGLGQVGLGDLAPQPRRPGRRAEFRHVIALQAPDLGQHGGGHGRVLAHVEGRGAEAEGLGLPAQRAEMAHGDRLGADGRERVLQHPQIGDEHADRGIGPGLARQRRLHAPGHRRQRLAEDLARVAPLQLLGLAAAFDDRPQRCLDRGWQRDDPRGDANLGRRPGQRLAVALDDRPAGPLEGVARDRGDDVRVAVTVAADPGMEPHARGDLDPLAEAVATGEDEGPEQLRDRVEDRVAEELQAPFDLVRQPRALEPQLAGHPEQVDVALDVAEDRLALARGPALRLE